MFRAVSAAVIGGTLLAGGEGTAIGALFGALFLGVLRDGLTLEGVNADYLDFILGIAILGAMVINIYVGRVRKGSGVLTLTSDDVLRVEHVAKRFGPVTALRDVNLHLRKGEVLGLLGDNGAGKSTLIKIISGFQKPDEGRILLRGEEVELKSVDHARSLGIDCVYQDLALVNELSVLPEHVPAAREASTSRSRCWPTARWSARRARRSTRSASTSRASTCPVARLSGGQRQAIAVARTVTSDADIILLDEPLAAMGAKEGAMILDLVARLRAEGRVSIIMIAHNYVHVLEACDRVNLIQDGEITFDKPTAETSVEELNEIVVEEYRRARPAADGDGRSVTGGADGASTHNGRCSDAKVTQDRAPLVRLIAVVALAGALAAASASTATPPRHGSHRRGLSIAKSPFGSVGGTAIDRYTLANRAGCPSRSSPTAASSSQLSVPDRRGRHRQRHARLRRPRRLHERRGVSAKSNPPTSARSSAATATASRERGAVHARRQRPTRSTSTTAPTASTAAPRASTSRCGRPSRSRAATGSASG